MTPETFFIRQCGFVLQNRARFRVFGADRLRYLNGQLTQDIRRVSEQLALPACVTSAKGRLQGEVWVVAESAGPTAFLLDAPGELRETLLLRLERYIISEEVFVEDVTGLATLIHFPCPEVPSVLNEKKIPKVSAARLGQPGWDVWVPAGSFEEVCERLDKLLGSEADYERLRILRGIPAWGSELNEETLPPEAGLDKTHVDYHKGCYIGQEVISRLKSVGHVNRILKKLCTRANQNLGMEHPLLPPPVQGDALYNPQSGESPVGSLTSVASDGETGFLALGYIKRNVDMDTLKTASGWEFVVGA